MPCRVTPWYARVNKTALFRRAMMDERQKTEIEAAAFRRLVQHFRDHPEVQNIDVMNLAGFCRNCLSKWMAAAAEERGVALGYEDARTLVYGMPYEEWKKKNQTEAGPDKLKAFADKSGADKH
jgi:hypothetical protein